MFLPQFRRLHYGLCNPSRTQGRMQQFCAQYGTNLELSVICGYSPDRKVTNVRFENRVINGETIYDDMPGKPKWYKTADMARIFVGPNADIPIFTK